MTSTTISSTLAAVATAAATLASSPSLLSPSAAVATSSTSGSHKDENNGECQLLGPFAVVVQAALGLLALLSLVFKRWRERPQRPVKVWAFDASKQVFGSALLHLANLLMSMFSSGELAKRLAKAAADKVSAESNYQPNPCSYYLLNLGIDTTLGIPILICILKVLHIGASYTPLARPPESIKSGNYGNPPKATWWLKQSFIYFGGLVGMKICVFIIFQLCPWIVEVGDWALRWTEGNEAIQIAFVMLIFPLIMNGMQYYIVDIFIKKQEPVDKEADDAEHGQHDADDEQGGLLAGQDRDHALSMDDDRTRKNSADTDTLADQSLDLGPGAGKAGGEGSSLGRSAEAEGLSERSHV